MILKSSLYRCDDHRCMAPFVLSKFVIIVEDKAKREVADIPHLQNRVTHLSQSYISPEPLTVKTLSSRMAC